MSDVVYCHSCTSGWFKDEWGLICPHCESEAVEVVSTFWEMEVNIWTLIDLLHRLKCKAIHRRQKNLLVEPRYRIYWRINLIYKEQYVGISKPFATSLFVLTLLYLALLYGETASEENIRSRDTEDEATKQSTAESSKEDTPEEEVVIAVMGVTGSGKSTFIRTMTGDGGVHVGHGLESGNSVLYFEVPILHIMIQTHPK